MGADAATIFGTTTIVGIIMAVAPCYGRVPAPTEGGVPGCPWGPCRHALDSPCPSRSLLGELLPRCFKYKYKYKCKYKYKY